MAWEVEYTDQFGEWWETLSEEEQDSIAAIVRVLEERGPTLRYTRTAVMSNLLAIAI